MSSRGHERERKVKLLLEGEDWLVVRAAGSLGDFDLLAVKAGRPPRVIEVKSTVQPYSHFGPEDRARVSFCARLAGGVAELAVVAVAVVCCVSYRRVSGRVGGPRD